jgi:hypothetical protein
MLEQVPWWAEASPVTRCLAGNLGRGRQLLPGPLPAAPPRPVWGTGPRHGQRVHHAPSLLPAHVSASPCQVTGGRSPIQPGRWSRASPHPVSRTFPPERLQSRSGRSKGLGSPFASSTPSGRARVGDLLRVPNLLSYVACRPNGYSRSRDREGGVGS